MFFQQSKSLFKNLFVAVSFTFMHLADAFIQSDLHCIQVTVFTFLSALAFPENRTHDLGVASTMLYYLSYRKVLILWWAATNKKKCMGNTVVIFLGVNGP